MIQIWRPREIDFGDPDVSVCIPIRPGDSIRKETLAGLEAQTFEGSLEVIAYQSKAGAGANRNRARKAARAPLLIWIDTDITLRPQTLEQWSDILEDDPEVCWVSSTFSRSGALSGVQEPVRISDGLDYTSGVCLIRAECSPPWREKEQRLLDRFYFSDLDAAGCRGARSAEIGFDAFYRKGDISVP